MEGDGGRERLGDGPDRVKDVSVSDVILCRNTAPTTELGDVNRVGVDDRAGRR